MAKVDTLFMTKADEKPYHLAPHIPNITHIRECPPPRGGYQSIIYHSLFQAPRERREGECEGTRLKNIRICMGGEKRFILEAKI